MTLISQGYGTGNTMCTKEHSGINGTGPGLMARGPLLSKVASESLPGPLPTPHTKDDERGKLPPPLFSSPQWQGRPFWAVRFEGSWLGRRGSTSKHWCQHCGNSSLFFLFPTCIQNGEPSASPTFLCGCGPQLVWVDQGANRPFLALCLTWPSGRDLNAGDKMTFFAHVCSDLRPDLGEI